MTIKLGETNGEAGQCEAPVTYPQMAAPQVGEIVLVFQHEAADGVHSYKDAPAIVLQTLDEYKLRVKVFGEPQDVVVTVGRFEAPVDADGNPVIGGFYWRPRDEPPPDFDLLYSKEP